MAHPVIPQPPPQLPAPRGFYVTPCLSQFTRFTVPGTKVLITSMGTDISSPFTSRACLEKRGKRKRKIEMKKGKDLQKTDNTSRPCWLLKRHSLLLPIVFVAHSFTFIYYVFVIHQPRQSRLWGLIASNRQTQSDCPFSRPRRCEDVDVGKGKNGEVDLVSISSATKLSNRLSGSEVKWVSSLLLSFSVLASCPLHCRVSVPTVVIGDISVIFCYALHYFSSSRFL